MVVVNMHHLSFQGSDGCWSAGGWAHYGATDSVEVVRETPRKWMLQLLGCGQRVGCRNFGGRRWMEGRVRTVIERQLQRRNKREFGHRDVLGAANPDYPPQHGQFQGFFGFLEGGGRSRWKGE